MALAINGAIISIENSSMVSFFIGGFIYEDILFFLASPKIFIKKGR